MPEVQKVFLLAMIRLVLLILIVYFPECDVIKKVRCVRFTNIFEINKPEEMSLAVTLQRDDFVIEQEHVYVNDCDNVVIDN